MRIKILTVVLALLATVPLGAEAKVYSSPLCASFPDPSSERHDHAAAKHSSCIYGLRRLGEVEVSKEAGLGQVEVHRDLAAVVQRDEGAVALIDIKNPRKPKVLGRYDDDIPDSFDGDLTFSHDGKWLIYARQTHQFSKDGIHVLDVSNPREPRLAFYQPQGGNFRVDYLRHESGEYIVTMDAITGLVVNRFEPTTGALVPVFVDALPALKVGGPASAGVHIDPKDPKLGIPLLYATNGQTGLDVYDLSQPLTPEKIGSWTEAGLADVEVRATKGKRVVFAASEYWFDSASPATVHVLDATKLDNITRPVRWVSPLPAEEPWRINGMELTGRQLHIAESHSGLLTFNLKGRTVAGYRRPAPINKSASLKAAPYAMDVESSGGLLYLSDASSGILTVLKTR